MPFKKEMPMIYFKKLHSINVSIYGTKYHIK